MFAGLELVHTYDHDKLKWVSQGMDQSLYLCIVYAICAIAFVILAVVSKPLYANLCCIICHLVSSTKVIRYFKRVKLQIQY